MEAPEILVFAVNSPRIRYMFEHVLSPRMGIRFLLTDQEENFFNGGNDIPKLIYAPQNVISDKSLENLHTLISHEPRLPRESLLQFPSTRSDRASGDHNREVTGMIPEPDILQHPVMNAGGRIELSSTPDWYEGLPSWTMDKESGVPDPIAEIFIHLSRYEEYFNDARDRHQRFCASESILFRAGVVRIPVVDRWISLLHQWLYDEKKVSFPPEPAPCKVHPTFDIDLPWKYLNKKARYHVYRLCMHLLKGQASKLWKEAAVWAGKETDPFDTYEKLLGSTRKHHPQPCVFFQTGGSSRYDAGSRYQTKAFRQLINRLSKQWIPGMHPSYLSSDEESVNSLKAEKAQLEMLTGRDINISRQHYLRVRLPHTYRHLIEAGISADYSMGFADSTGWRAGTAFPFTWYDLEAEKATKLTVHPFGLMDGTLKNYMKLEPDEAIIETELLWKELKATGGSLTFIWHNSSFDPADGWDSWDAVYYHLLQLNTP